LYPGGEPGSSGGTIFVTTSQPMVTHQNVTTKGANHD